MVDLKHFVHLEMYFDPNFQSVFTKKLKKQIEKKYLKKIFSLCCCNILGFLKH